MPFSRAEVVLLLVYWPAGVSVSERVALWYCDVVVAQAPLSVQLAVPASKLSLKISCGEPTMNASGKSTSPPPGWCTVTVSCTWWPAGQAASTLNGIGLPARVTEPIAATEPTLREAAPSWIQGSSLAIETLTFSALAATDSFSIVKLSVPSSPGLTALAAALTTGECTDR